MQVIIVGAGPSGLGASIHLRNLGFKVTILESREKIERKVCGEYLCPTGVDELESLGILEEAKKLFLPIVGMRLVSHSGIEVKTHFPEHSKQNNLGLSVNREIFDSLLLSRAKALGVKVRFGERLQAIKAVAEGYFLETNKNQYTTALLIGADGRNSFVSKFLNLNLIPSKKRVTFHVFLPLKVSHGRLGEMHLFSDGSYAGLDPISATEMNFSLCCDAEMVKNQGGALSTINYYIKQSSILLKEFGELTEKNKIHTAFPVTHRVRASFAPQVALIGDAGGFIDPLTGEGIFVALWTGRALAQSLGSPNILSNREFLNKRLKHYHYLRRKKFRQKMILSYFFQWVISKPQICEKIARFLKKDPARGDIFIGVIGNIYSPLIGLKELLLNIGRNLRRKIHA